MTIEGASAAAGHDKNGNLLGFATTDEIGSVMDMTKDEIRKLGMQQRGAQGEAGWGHVNVEPISPSGG